MDQESAIRIAKDKKSSAEQLAGVVNVNDEINRLLAKHKNTTAEMLDELGASLDDKTVALVTEHPNISKDLLDNLGAFHPEAMFRNPVLPELLKKQKAYLGTFFGEEFEDALKSKNLPDFVVESIAKFGKMEHQAIFLFATKRSPEICEKFRGSKHHKIVAQLLERDDETYLAWASDLGFQKPETIDVEDGDLRAQIDEWVEDLWRHNSVLSKQLVPASGSASTLQGELVRALGRIESEHFRNGMWNWGDGSGYYEGLTELLHASLKTEESFSRLVKAVFAADIAEIKKSGQLGKAAASGKTPRAGSLGTNFFMRADVERSHQRIGALITLWCQRHAAPVPFVGT